MSAPTILRLRHVASAPRARGRTAIVDVLRAFTTSAYAIAGGAERILLVATAHEAFELRARIDGAVLVGEDGGRQIPGFDLGNSPEAVERADLAGRTLVLRSTSGVQAVVRARSADAVCLASLVTASATARWLAQGAGPITLLAAGTPGEDDAEEDEACADLLAALVLGEPADPAGAARRVRASRAGERALDPALDWITPGDLERAVAVDRFEFALTVRAEGGLLVARRWPDG